MSFDARLLSGIGVMMAVVESGTFVLAAEAVGLTPSGVSRAVARLEQRVGARLFHRTPRAVTLTEEGRRFHAEVAPLLTGIQEAAEEIAGTGAKVRGRLKISADPWFARVVLAPRLPALLARYPELHLDLLASNHREEMMAGGGDLALRFGPVEPSKLVARKILETRIVTCAAPAYLARHGVPRRPEEVARYEALLFRDPQSGRPFTWEFHRGGEIVAVDVRGRFVTDDPSAALAACAAGQGLFQSFRLGLDPWLETRQLQLVLEEWSEESFPLYAYYRTRRHAPAKLEAFLSFIGDPAV